MSNPTWGKGLLLEARPCAGPDLESSDPWDVTYRVTSGRENEDRRKARRRRTRLRCGKLLDVRNAFVIECRIYDRSTLGARLRLDKPIPDLDPISLYEDQTEQIHEARLIWQGQGELGIAFTSTGRLAPITHVQRAFLRGRYYAMRD
ncbi:type IV pilus assembly PilZ [Beijerinckia indica]|uniref:Type IV pilus assembly PilZ n=1 Tax=Beijerinckia indica subsp. indica (strain ATCC 9039 / DSM 1715 / NCIMB 8712) TaxID=395963 RepID=B2IHB6_BEII9|nr:type IV pilus assembly PilZ [Beijerinckia indica]ACB95901.1 type IV pilus assembly PilZ [Beijerinckia indica subsp. indica ATCC 9039]